MIVSAHQPAFIPWLGYFHKIALADVFVIMDDVQFEKNSFTNRNKILNKGEDLWLTIPVKSKNHFDKKIAQIEIADTHWKKKHLKSIEQNYKAAPFYEEVMEIINAVYQLESNLLIDYTNSFLFKALDYLNIPTQVMNASVLDIEGKKLEYVVELTIKTGGDVFVFGKQGVEYADKGFMKEKKVLPYFQNYVHPVYEQHNDTFVPFLAVIDVMFHHGRSSSDIIMKNNVTKNELHELVKKAYDVE